MRQGLAPPTLMLLFIEVFELEYQKFAKRYRDFYFLF